jgi:hypothetical protein
MKVYEIKVLRDQLLTSSTANTFDEAVKIFKQKVSDYRNLYNYPRIICNTDSKFELIDGSRHMCIWIEQTDSSKFFDEFERAMERFF